MLEIPSTASLVKYDSPVLVRRSVDRKSSRARVLKSNPTPLDGVNHVPTPPPTPSRQKLSAIDSKNAQQVGEILCSILPPREWSENGEEWAQRVSSVPATKTDVVSLQEELDLRLQHRQARETGICAVRRDLYSQCFDELIRHVAINCPERGLLLLRVRDEIVMTIAAYHMLYDSSVAFSMRKSLQAQQWKEETEIAFATLEEEKRELERQVNELKTKCEQTEKRASEQRLAEDKKRSEEVQFWKKTNVMLTSQLDSVKTAKK